MLRRGYLGKNINLGSCCNGNAAVWFFKNWFRGLERVHQQTIFAVRTSPVDRSVRGPHRNTTTDRKRHNPSASQTGTGFIRWTHRNYGRESDGSSQREPAGQSQSKWKKPSIAEWLTIELPSAQTWRLLSEWIRYLGNNCRNFFHSLHVGHSLNILHRLKTSGNKQRQRRRNLLWPWDKNNSELLEWR